MNAKKGELIVKDDNISFYNVGSNSGEVDVIPMVPKITVIDTYSVEEVDYIVLGKTEDFPIRPGELFVTPITIWNNLIDDFVPLARGKNAEVKHLPDIEYDPQLEEFFALVTIDGTTFAIKSDLDIFTRATEEPLFFTIDSEHKLYASDNVKLYFLTATGPADWVEYKIEN